MQLLYHALAQCSCCHCAKVVVEDSKAGVPYAAGAGVILCMQLRPSQHDADKLRPLELKLKHGYDLRTANLHCSLTAATLGMLSSTAYLQAQGTVCTLRVCIKWTC